MASLPLRRLRFALALILGLIFVGTLGYHFIEGMPFLDALYMTIITLSTVGFSEVKPLTPLGRIFTVFLILAGVGAVAWAVQNGVEVLLGDQALTTIGKRRMERRIAKLQGHYIICGYGRMGRETGAEFQRREVPYVVIESAPDVVEMLLEEDVPVIAGDATQDEVLIMAGVERARGLVAAVDSDADNVLIVLSARVLNPRLMIVARAELEESERKLYRAGANRVVTPYTIGGRRIALAVLRPTVFEYLSTVVFSEELHTEMGELHVGPNSPFAGKTIKSSELRNRWGATVIAVKKATGDLVISPVPDLPIEVGDVLVVVAERTYLRELERVS